MKTLQLLLICFLVPVISIGQDMTNPVISEEVRFMSQGEQNAFKVQIPNTSIKMVKDTWEKYIRQFKGKTKQDKKTGEFMSNDCKAPEFSQNTVDLYARFGESAKNVVTVYFWIDLGGTYLNSNAFPEKGKAAGTHLQAFSRMVAKNEAVSAMEAEEKVLKDLEKDLSKLEKDKEGYQKKIENAKELIAKMESAIEENILLQATKQQDIEGQLEVVNLAKAEVQKHN